MYRKGILGLGDKVYFMEDKCESFIILYIKIGFQIKFGLKY